MNEIMSDPLFTLAVGFIMGVAITAAIYTVID